MFTNPLLRENEELKKRLAITLERISDLERALELAKPCAAPVPPPPAAEIPAETPAAEIPAETPAAVVLPTGVEPTQAKTDGYFGTNDAKVTHDNQPPEVV